LPASRKTAFEPLRLADQSDDLGRNVSKSGGLKGHGAAVGRLQKTVMADLTLYPLRFEPIYQYRIWGGRALAHWLKQPLPGKDSIGEAWVLSDRDDNPSRVADGPLKGSTLADLIARFPDALLGTEARRFARFPLLIKFLDVRKMLSVQVHPPDGRTELIPPGESGKTEAWVVLEAAARSRVYAGLKLGATAGKLRALSNDTVDNCLASFTPRAGEAVLIEAGVVHSLGDGVVVVEVQENSDVTFRLFDWDHIDPKTGERRPLQVDEAMACVDLGQGAVGPARPRPDGPGKTLLIDCPHFRLWRREGETPFTVGAADQPRVLIGLDGAGRLDYGGIGWPLEKGETMLLPAVAGERRFHPAGAVTLLEIALPDSP
jgi:mannose-6-phosphate isomerase